MARWLGLSVFCICFIVKDSAFAGTIYTEVGDAGELLGTAALVNTSPGGTALTAIDGTLSPYLDSADQFKIYLTGGQTFSATTTSNHT